MTGLALAVAPAAADAAAVHPAASHRLTSSQVRSLRRGADRSVIVIFKNQERDTPATSARSAQRRALVENVQSPVVSQLRQLHAAQLHSYTLLNAVSADVSPAEQARLAGDPSVAEVVPNATTHLDFGMPATASRVSAPSMQSLPKTSTGSQVCQAAGSPKVELDPQALETIRANNNVPHAAPTAASLGITGAGVSVAFIAEGIDVDQPNFQRNGVNVITDQADFTGEGTPTDTSGGEASLDASSIGAQGTVPYSVKLPSGATCTFVVEGAAPGADMVSLKAFPSNYDATTTSLLEAIDYAVSTDHVNVLNESFGYNPLPDTMTDVIRQADEAATRAGTVVATSTGDAGPTSTQGSPSTDPAVIAAGASTTYRTYAQQDIENYTKDHAKGWENDNTSGLSSSGSTFGLKGPNLLAPGDLNWVTCNPAASEFGACVSGGTSEAAPLTSATAALVIQAYRKTHDGATPSPALVKKIIVSTTDDLGLPADQQGSGRLDSYRAVLEAESIGQPAHSAVGNSVALNTSDITATAATKSSVTRRVTVTNTGSTTRTVRFAGRTLSAPRTVASHRFTESGATWTKTFSFTVAKGKGYLDAHLATESPAGYVDMQLIDPSGRLANAALTQGLSDTANAGVRVPEAGTWKAYLQYGQGAKSAKATQFVATTQSWHPFGTLKPGAVTLAPGHAATVTATLPLPSAAGDRSAAIAVTDGSDVQTSIPVALRALVPFHKGVGRFATDVTGGNGRAGSSATAAYFAFTVPAHSPELNVATSYLNGPYNNYSMYLIAPDGEALGHASNQLVTGGTATDPTTTSTEKGAVSHVLAPQAGRWTAIVALANPASGPSAIRPLTGTIDFQRFATTSRGVPNSTSTLVPVGSSHTVAIRVTNHSAVPQSYFLDARLKQQVGQTLTPLTGATVTLPLSTSTPIPQWIVPTDTSSISATVSSSAPVTFDMSPYLGNFGGELNGDPQVGATQNGNSAAATWKNNPVTPGDWNVDPALVGTYRSAGATSTPATLSMTATTRAFDSAVHTNYGDLWSGDNSVNPVIVDPGQTTTLYATITPTQAGKVQGTVFVDTATSIAPYGSPVPAGDQVAAVPYEYTAK